ncbi:MAG: glycosyl hydrolase family 18 protein, partial [Candidatus Sulfotelmatobacter sp.]
MRFSSRFLVRLLLLAAVLAGAIHSQPANAQDSSAAQPPAKRLVGDYGYWSRTQTPPYSAAQIPFEKLTHINHDGVSFNADGSLSVPDGFLEPELLTKAHAKGVKVLLLIGGDFSGVETNGTLLTLIEKLTAFAAKHDYDGFDIDW